MKNFEKRCSRSGVSKITASRPKRSHFIRAHRHFVNNEINTYLRNICWFSRILLLNNIHVLTGLTVHAFSVEGWTPSCLECTRRHAGRAMWYMANAVESSWWKVLYQDIFLNKAGFILSICRESLYGCTVWKRKNSFRPVASAVRESAVCLHCIVVLQHKGKWMSLLTELISWLNHYAACKKL